MRLGGGPIPRGRASEDRDLMSYRVKQEFLKVTTTYTRFIHQTEGTGIAEVREGRKQRAQEGPNDVGSCAPR
jgi:hypothetical protein